MSETVGGRLDPRQADASGGAVKKAITPAVERELVSEMEASYSVSQRRACSTLAFPRSTVRYHSIADLQIALRLRLRDLATSRVGYGYRRLHILLQREGWQVNHNPVYRLYREEGLRMRKRPPRRRVACCKREIRPVAPKKNECWSMDFVSDQLFDGRRIRVLTLVDNHTRESLALHVDQRVRGRDVVRILERVVDVHGLPSAIRVDNGPEFLSKDLDLWAYWKAGLQPAGQADGQRFYRVVQRSIPSGVPERALVFDTGRRQAEDRGVASGLQRMSAAQ